MVKTTNVELNLTEAELAALNSLLNLRQKQLYKAQQEMLTGMQVILEDKLNDSTETALNTPGTAHTLRPKR
jgi:hypothetical protein